MSHDTDVFFTVDQVAACTTALRTALGKPPAHFTTSQFVGMISDEIKALRADRWSDAEIVALVHESTGSVLDVDTLQTFFVDAERRGNSQP